MKMIVESMIECRLAGETEVLGENLPQRHFCPSQNPMCPPGFEHGPPRWEAGERWILEKYNLIMAGGWCTLVLAKMELRFLQL
jgi:hypothetical protein